MIRKMKISEIEETALIWLRSGQAEYSYLPKFLELDEKKAIEVFTRHIHTENTIYVSEANAQLVGFMAINESEIDRLYVAPEQQRMGIGSGLLKYAKQISPARLELYTHQQNHRARSFYEKHGFVAVKFGVSPEPECVPDVLYKWSGV